MKQRICSLLLILCLLSQLWVPTVFASGMTTGTDGKAFIAEHQGSTYYDLSAAEKEVNTFINKYDLRLEQHQFDALVDLVCAFPSSRILTSGNYHIERLIGGGNYSDAELASALTAWGVKLGNDAISESGLRRRLREAKLFLYGSYTGDCDTDFRYVIFNPNGGTLHDDFNSVMCYTYNQPYGDLGIPTRGGMYFTGWYTMAGSDGTHIFNSTSADQNRTLYAHWSDSPVSDPNGGGSSGGTGNFVYPELKVSESLIQFIKEQEGFSPTRYWDYSQYTIGYGTEWKPDDYPSGVITEEEADYELRLEIAKFEKEIDRVLAKGTVRHNRHQYDAIVSFTFNLGGQWMSASNRIYQYILFGHPSEGEFVNAIGAWASAGGTVSSGLMQRRIDEADMYLNGNYQRFSKTYFGAHLTVNTGDKTAVVDSSGKSYALYYCRAGEPVGILPTASREGYYLVGWLDGFSNTIYTPETIAPGKVLTLKAQWAEGEKPPVTDPPVTEPPVTEPDPPVTEPPVTEPDPPIPTIQFDDVPADAWYTPYVTVAVARELLNGLGKGRFGPNNTMTRAMAVTVLYRMAGSPEPTQTHPFIDVEEEMWYSDAIAWAYENAVVNGVSADRFGLNDSVTRQQLVTLLYRFAQQVGVDTSGRDPLEDFTDVDRISDYAKDPFRWAVAMGIINGTDGALLPGNSATRAQCAKIMVLFSDFMI